MRAHQEKDGWLISSQLTYPLGVAIGIACAGAILGEAGCLYVPQVLVVFGCLPIRLTLTLLDSSVVFKYCFTGYVEKRIEQRVRWAAIARITREAGYRGILVIRYSIVPPREYRSCFLYSLAKLWFQPPLL